MTSLGVATHRQNRQGRPGLETTGSGLPCHWEEFETSTMSSQGPGQGADSSREEEGELLGGVQRHIAASVGEHSCSVLSSVFYREGMRGYL